MPMGGSAPVIDLSGYQAKSEKGTVNGYAALNGSGLVDSDKLPGSLIVNPMSAQNDLIIGGSTAQLNLALSGLGAIISTGWDTNASALIDGNDLSSWSSGFSITSIGWIKIDLGQARTIRAHRLVHPGGGNKVTRWTLSSSEDGTNWTLRYTTPADNNDLDTGALDLGAEITARYWILGAVAGDMNNQWIMSTLSLLSPAPTAGWPDCLPAPSGRKSLRSGATGLVAWLASLDVFIADASNPPTDAELDTAIAAASAVGAGYAAIVDDNNAHANVYLVVSDGAGWWQLALTACA